VQGLLDQLVEEGIIIEDVGETGRQKSVYQKNGSGEITGTKPAGFIEKRIYFFAHDVWRSAIMKMMLRIRQAVIHRYTAVVLEEKFGLASTDYMQKMRVFAHWKASGDTTKAATLALAIGDSLEELGMSGDSVKVFGEALSMWEERGDEESEDGLTGFTLDALESIDALDLDLIIRLKCGIGRCASKMGDPTLCVASFSSALKILQICPAADELEDRSVAFPVFSGLFHSIRLGKIEQDDDFAYEQLLVKCFLHEARAHGHDIHFLRGLAMQGELFGKLGKYEQAFESHSELEKIYDPSKHSRMMCKTYGVDLAVQSFARCAIWHLQNNNGMEALEKCRRVLHEFLPEMDPRNVHNTMELIYPVIWVLKDLGQAAEARDAFNKYVVQKCKLYYDEGTLISQPLFAPILMILDLVSNLCSREGERLHEYRLWAMNPQNLSFGLASNTLMSHFGRAPDSISSEICLLLAEQTEDENERNILLRNGTCASKELAIILQTSEFKTSYAYSQAESILEDLEDMAASVGLDILVE
jgi:tetratricopeptide (TPR) repeat protein